MHFQKHTVMKHPVILTVNELKIDELTNTEHMVYETMNNEFINNESTINDLTMPEKCLLIMNKHSPHCCIKLFQFGREYNIGLICLTPNVTYFL